MTVQGLSSRFWRGSLRDRRSGQNAGTASSILHDLVIDHTCRRRHPLEREQHARSPSPGFSHRRSPVRIARQLDEGGRSDSTELGRTTTPVTPSSTTSGSDTNRVATTGRAAAMASSAVTETLPVAVGGERHDVARGQERLDIGHEAEEAHPARRAMRRRQSLQRLTFLASPATSSKAGIPSSRIAFPTASMRVS